MKLIIPSPSLPLLLLAIFLGLPVAKVPSRTRKQPVEESEPADQGAVPGEIINRPV